MASFQAIHNLVEFEMEVAMPHWLSSPKMGASCAIIAEIAQAHDGSLGQAHAYIECAAYAGADAVKFQTHIAAEESTALEPWRIKFSRQDETRYDYWRRMEFSPEQWAGLKVHAEEKGLIFLSSPFSFAAVDLLRKLDVVAWKVASGELTNLPMISEMAKGGKPIMLSTGMSPLSEVADAVAVVKNNPHMVFQCTTSYPSPPEAIGLNVLHDLRTQFNCGVGLSDHSGTVYPGLAAVAAQQIEVVEVHLTMSRAQFGPDVVASVTPEELRMLVDGIHFIEKMAAAPLDKSKVASGITAMRDIFFKSVVAAQDLPMGTVLTAKHLALKKPGTGVAAAKLEAFFGQTLQRALQRDEQLLFTDVRQS